MPTRLTPGDWHIHARVVDSSFRLESQVVAGDCEDLTIFDEIDLFATVMELSAVYRNTGSSDCAVYWETSNVTGSWELVFEQVP